MWSIVFLVWLKERDRSNAFRAVGLAAIAVGTDITPHLDPVLSVIRTTLPAIKDASLRCGIALSVQPSVYSSVCMSSVCMPGWPFQSGSFLDPLSLIQSMA